MSPSAAAALALRLKSIIAAVVSTAAKFGADYGARTRHLDLGKVALYQMS